ncbi:hypothetical protein DL98DRAFT_376113, partial [Cadophora sp. DSE1049]
IPDRIRCHVPLQVRDSAISGAGRAVFAMQKVKMGEVIFKIPNPLVAVRRTWHNICREKQPDFEDGLRICDNCFAYEEHGGVMTILNAGTKFSSCNDCRTVLYCSAACQKDAWKHHH